MSSCGLLWPVGLLLGGEPGVSPAQVMTLPVARASARARCRGVGVDPGEAAEVEAVAGAGDGDVRQAGVGVADGFRNGLALGVVLVGVLGRGEVVGDLDGGPFAALGGVGGGDGDVGVLFIGELVDGGEDGVWAVGVDEVDEGLKVTSCGVVGGVVLQFAPG